jgi:hypothetical protein
MPRFLLPAISLLVLCSCTSYGGRSSGYLSCPTVRPIGPHTSQHREDSEWGVYPKSRWHCGSIIGLGRR